MIIKNEIHFVNFQTPYLFRCFEHVFKGNYALMNFLPEYWKVFQTMENMLIFKHAAIILFCDSKNYCLCISRFSTLNQFHEVKVNSKNARLGFWTLQTISVNVLVSADPLEGSENQFSKKMAPSKSLIFILSACNVTKTVLLHRVFPKIFPIDSFSQNLWFIFCDSLVGNRGKQIVYHEILWKKSRRNKENLKFYRLLKIF